MNKTLKLPVVVSLAELRDLRQRASAQGLPVSTWVRVRLGLGPLRRGRPRKAISNK